MEHTMINLPKGFPMYCNDLKQTIDEIDKNNLNYYNSKSLTKLLDTSPPIKLKNHFDYPRQENKHNSLDDAKWNKKLYKFLNNINF